MLIDGSMGRIYAYRRLDGQNFCLLVNAQARGRMESGKESRDEPGDNRLRLDSFGRGRSSNQLRGHVQLAAAGQLPLGQPPLGSADGCASAKESIESTAAHFKCRCPICAKAVGDYGPRFACRHNRNALASGRCGSFVPLSTRSLSYARLK
jgi:hypothetical protein